MTAKRFAYDSKSVSILKDGEFWLDGNVDTACNHSEICSELNHLHELAEGNENQLLKVMTYLHDNYYEIWEKVNKECYDD